MDTEHVSTNTCRLPKNSIEPKVGAKAQDDLKLIFNSCNLQAPDRKHELAPEKRRGTTLG